VPDRSIGETWADARWGRNAIKRKPKPRWEWGIVQEWSAAGTGGWTAASWKVTIYINGDAAETRRYATEAEAREYVKDLFSDMHPDDAAERLPF